MNRTARIASPRQTSSAPSRAGPPSCVPPSSACPAATSSLHPAPCPFIRRSLRLILPTPVSARPRMMGSVSPRSSDFQGRACPRVGPLLREIEDRAAADGPAPVCPRRLDQRPHHVRIQRALFAAVADQRVHRAPAHRLVWVVPHRLQQRPDAAVVGHMVQQQRAGRPDLRVWVRQARRGVPPRRLAACRQRLRSRPRDGRRLWENWCSASSATNSSGASASRTPRAFVSGSVCPFVGVMCPLRSAYSGCASL